MLGGDQSMATINPDILHDDPGDQQQQRQQQASKVHWQDPWQVMV
jgi:hypothetical protein